MKATLYNIAYTLLICSILASCKSTSTESTAEEHHDEEGIVELTETQYKSAEIQYGKIEMKDLHATIEVNGMLDVPPQNMVSVSALMGGFVKSTDLLQGMKVKKGDVLLTLQNPSFILIQTQYLENIQKLKYLELEYKRQEELARENVAAAKTFQQVSSEYNSLQATIGGLTEELKILNINPSTLTKSNIRSVVSIYSPINGYVTTVNVNIGKYVAPQDIICEIVNTEHLHAELTVFEKDISKIKVGQKITFYLVNESSKERTATVYLINHQISADRTIRVHAHFDADPSLMPNMYLKAFIEIGDDNKKVVVPEKAIAHVGDKNYIFIKEVVHKHIHNENIKGERVDTTEIIQHEEEYIFRAIEVNIGLTQLGYTEIILPSGFDSKNAVVVIKGTYALLSKMNNSSEEGHAH
ncbi:efflux RND transporter periplasmic adaptor subunit [Cytophaga aurantiaca]|uniref:efflux RND transporter periplasmic adaptor subunit n=1 Tax=Cytophaga aurantiaca TaxID=29530 RepID=UPI00036652A4|nr:efflux RND transporter periplasmic adaptor subunit [Cytophaga aurantiaca]